MHDILFFCFFMINRRSCFGDIFSDGCAGFHFCLLGMPFLQAGKFFSCLVQRLIVGIGSRIGSSAAGFCAGNPPDFLPCFFYALDVVHRFCIMRYAAGSIDGTGAGIVSRFSIDKGFIPGAIAVYHLSQVFYAAINIFFAVVRIDMELGCRVRHELGNANSAYAGYGGVVKIAFCRKYGCDQNGIDMIRIGSITDILGNIGCILTVNIFADLVIDEFFLRNSMDRTACRHAHPSCAQHCYYFIPHTIETPFIITYYTTGTDFVQTGNVRGAVI